MKWNKLGGMLPNDASSEDKALLAELLSIQHPDADFLKTMTPQHRKSMAFATILRQLDELARKQPILAILEDIHWADPTTLGLLDLVVEAIQRVPVLLVITARPEVNVPWASRPHVTVKLLSGLDDELAATLIKQIASGRELPRDVIERIIAHADSVPLFYRGADQDGSWQGPRRACIDCVAFGRCRSSLALFLAHGKTRPTACR